MKHTTLLGSEQRLQAVVQAIAILREARNLLVAAGAPRSARRVRLALTSVEGARRHADYRVVRTGTPTSKDDVPLGSPGRLVTVDGRHVTRTIERLAGTCGVTQATRNPDGSLAFTFDGLGTAIAWDSAETVTRGGQAVLIAEDGGEVLEGTVRLVPL